MQIKVLSEVKTICANRDSLQNYFAWPSVARLADGTLAMVASGFRLGHVCPFGKVVMCNSKDEGESWSQPRVILDTPLDDRDAGIAVQPDGTILVTSFNNTVRFQQDWAQNAAPVLRRYIQAHLEYLQTRVREEDYLGSTFVISRDGGASFGDFGRIPVTAPHGPLALGDGSFLYIGSRFLICGAQPDPAKTHLACYRLYENGESEFVADIPDVTDRENVLSCEPHAVRLPDGRILVHIRVQRDGGSTVFTLYQSESEDGGKTFSVPHCLLETCGGAPAHLLRRSDGLLISVYGYRVKPFGIRAMFSTDNGKSWETDRVLWDRGVNLDLGYPCSVERNDGTILTVFYEHETADGPAVIRQIVWTVEPEN